MKNPDNETRKHIRIQDLLPKSREKDRHKSHKREPGNSVEYGTDSKFNSRSQSYLGELEESPMEEALEAEAEAAPEAPAEEAATEEQAKA